MSQAPAPRVRTQAPCPQQPRGRCRSGGGEQTATQLCKPPCHAPDGGDTGHQTRPLWGAEGEGQAEEALGQGEQLRDPSQGQRVNRPSRTLTQLFSKHVQAHGTTGDTQHALPALEEAERGHDL